VRRGQLFSMDALISIVLIIMVLGTVSATSESLRSEIASMVGWYERANIADNMLDVLTKSPGEPEDWEENPSTLRAVGLRSNLFSQGIDYNKIEALAEHFNDPEILEFLENLSLKKDFLLEIYVSSPRVEIEGRFPRVYLQNYTFGENNPSGGANFKIDGAGSPGREFQIHDIFLRKANGNTYNITTICDFAGNNKKIDLDPGDYLRVITAEPVSIDDTKDSKEAVIVPANTTIELYIKNINKTNKGNGKGNEGSNLQIIFDDCPSELKITGQGNIVVTVSAYDNPPEITVNYTALSDLQKKESPTYVLSIINGSSITDSDVITRSMSSSPWITSAERLSIITRREYNLSTKEPSGSEPMIYGTLRYKLPSNTIMRISAPNTVGNISIVVLRGNEKGGIWVYRDNANDNLNSTVIWYKSESSEPLVYNFKGNATSVKIPLTDIVGTGAPGDLFGAWLYSVTPSWAGSAKVEITPEILPYLGPKSDSGLIKIFVWDDR